MPRNIFITDYVGSGGKKAERIPEKFYAVKIKEENNGYTFFDTVEVYGTPKDPHQNEELVGEALKWVRSQVKIVSKFGICFDMGSSQVNHPLIPDARVEVIRSSVEGSLKRL